MSHILNLMLCKAFVRHQLTQVLAVHLNIEHLLHNWANLVHLNNCGRILGLLLPAVESITRRLRDEVSEEALLFHFDGLGSEDLATHVSVVLEQFSSPDLCQGVTDVAR